MYSSCQNKAGIDQQAAKPLGKGDQEDNMRVEAPDWQDIEELLGKLGPEFDYEDQ